ncbi:MAG: EscU/YscU/HrcU family type III secretion system export apparatus switch protein [Betaproteobacteria bacterium]|nr:EscU/YscU/HrcU family type III secretion system export apparatus switch protein [Betaproteobacteria bacterium]
MSEKTEQPSEKKIRDARKRGEVAKSKDFTQTALVVALFGYFIAAGRAIVEDLSALMLLPMNYIGVEFHSAVALVAEEFLLQCARLLAPILLIVIAVGLFCEAIQTGLNISFEALKPSGKKLNPVSNAKNIFSQKSLVEFLKSAAKIAVIGAVLYNLVLDSLPLLMGLIHRDVSDLGLIMAEVLKTMIIYTGLAYGVIALADLAWQRHSYTKGLMMSKDEVKQEYKGMEGDPLIKSQRKQLHMEMMQNDAVTSARSASVVITNPTHLAIALRYDEDTTPLPILLAKGEGALATQMIEAAREAGVPVMQDVPLARALFEQGQADQYIPSDLIEPVAAVLRLLRGLDSNASGAQP